MQDFEAYRPLLFSNGILIWHDACLVAVTMQQATQEGVQAIYTFLNPVKLAYIQRQLDTAYTDVSAGMKNIS